LASLYVQVVVIPLQVAVSRRPRRSYVYETSGVLSE